ncbi:MAG: hypothetical protein ABIQ18_21680 [Umezawaea sp.]
MKEVCNVENRAHAEKVIEAFPKICGAHFPRAVAKIAGAYLAARVRSGVEVENGVLVECAEVAA